MSEVAELARSLVAIDSVNPDLIPGARGESEVARFVADWLEGAGLDVSVEEAAPNRPNVVGVARGSGGGRTLLLNSHTDTVGVDAMERPGEARLDDSRLYGRGAYDMKGALAATMVAARRARKLELRGDVVVTAVIDEEVGSLGTTALVRTWRADGAIVAEPTDEQLCVAHKGFAAFEVVAYGRAAHGSRPDLGIDAITRMGPVLVAIDELDRALAERPAHPLAGRASVHASLIEGGQEYSSYPAECRLKGERRTLPGEMRSDVERELLGLVSNASGVEVQLTFSREPYEAAQDEPFVETVRRHAGGADLAGAAYWADSALLADAGIPTVLYGPRGEGAHAAVEWVEVESLERCADLYTAVAADFCS